jgi:hypothetical protein
MQSNGDWTLQDSQRDSPLDSQVQQLSPHLTWRRSCHQPAHDIRRDEETNQAIRDCDRSVCTDASDRLHHSNHDAPAREKWNVSWSQLPVVLSRQIGRGLYLEDDDG